MSSLKESKSFPGIMLSFLFSLNQKLRNYSKDRKRFEIGVSYIESQYCIVRVGERMSITNRLYGKSGGNAPTLLLQSKSDSGFFIEYMEHLENMWRSGRTKVYKLEGEALALKAKRYE